MILQVASEVMRRDWESFFRQRFTTWKAGSLKTTPNSLPPDPTKKHLAGCFYW